ncbi:MAG: hypothetical protein DMF75_22715 [Acidobacteria bacterium]|nr:MAG: hypothetical protein DMF75_22715 [Acidobacteriota bacterium]
MLVRRRSAKAKTTPSITEGSTMHNRSLPKIIKGLFTLLMLNAGLAASFTRTNAQTQSGNSFPNETSAQQVDDRPLSPRLAALRDRIKSGDREALDNFWKEISERGAPIVEEVPGNDRDVLVTIVWQAREETRNVFVFRIGDVSKPMARLLDTDLWYKTFQLQKGARFTYQLAANLPDPKEWRGITRFAGALRNDPFNPLQYAERSNDHNTGALRDPKFLLDECNVTSSSANSSATNAQFGFTPRTATVLTRSLMVCWYLQTVVFTSTRRTSLLLSII